MAFAGAKRYSTYLLLIFLIVNNKQAFVPAQDILVVALHSCVPKPDLESLFPYDTISHPAKKIAYGIAFDNHDLLYLHIRTIEETKYISFLRGKEDLGLFIEFTVG